MIVYRNVRVNDKIILLKITIFKATIFYTKKGEICSPDLTAPFYAYIAFYCILHTAAMPLA